MRKSWGLLPKVVSGEKMIESRWLKNRSAPWGKVKAGEVVYFKDSGEMVSVRAKVEKIMEFFDLTPPKIRQILVQYGPQDGLTTEQITYFTELFKDKRYCLLIFLKDIRVVRPFRINKKGFGLQASWLCVEDINSLVESV